MTGLDIRLKLARSDFTLNVELQLPDKGVTVLFGPSGSGKTTLLRCIAGLEPKAQGFLSFKGEPWQAQNYWRPTHQRPIGYVFQEANLLPHLSVLSNLRYGLSNLRYGLSNLRYGLARADTLADDHLNQAIEQLGISPLLHRKPHQLSGGERQVVALARALALNPQLLLMDEPLAALDVIRKRDLLGCIERLSVQLNIPILYVTHAPDEAARLADHLVMLQAGSVSASGPITHLLTQLDKPVYLGDEASTLWQVEVSALDLDWHLAQVAFSGGYLWVRNQNFVLGQSIRVRILASDVSLALQPGVSSIQNVLPGQVEALQDAQHPGELLVRMRLGEQFILSRITKKAAQLLGVTRGQSLWVQVKAVALLN